MSRIADLELLVFAADLGSLSAAARALDLSPAAASAAVKRLEALWNAPVFVRNTRSLRLSADGERILPAVRRAVDAWHEARQLASRQREPRAPLAGELQLSMPSDLGRNVLLPWLEAFQQRHPALALRLHLSDRNADLLRAPIDVALRYGPLRSTGHVALPLAPGNRRMLVASPDYLATHGVPRTPDELSRRETLRFHVSDRLPASWRLTIDDRDVAVPVQGRRGANDGEVVRRWALAGLGIAYKSWLDVAADVQAGLLRPVQPRWRGEPLPLFLVVPQRGQVTPAVQALRAFLAERLEPLSARLAALDS